MSRNLRWWSKQVLYVGHFLVGMVSVDIWSDSQDVGWLPGVVGNISYLALLVWIFVVHYQIQKHMNDIQRVLDKL